MVLHRAHIDLPSTRRRNLENGGALHQISHPRLICLRIGTKHTEIPTVAKYFNAFGVVFGSAIGTSFGHRLRIG